MERAVNNQVDAQVDDSVAGGLDADAGIELQVALDVHGDNSDGFLTPLDGSTVQSWRQNVTSTLHRIGTVFRNQIVQPDQLKILMVGLSLLLSLLLLLLLLFIMLFVSHLT